jgi:hypothetical protein
MLLLPEGTENNFADTIGQIVFITEFLLLPFNIKDAVNSTKIEK